MPSLYRLATSRRRKAMASGDMSGADSGRVPSVIGIPFENLEIRQVLGPAGNPLHLGESPP